MLPKNICGLAIILILLLNISIVSAGDSLEEADDLVGNIFKYIIGYIFTEDNDSVPADVVETDDNKGKASDEDVYIDLDSGVTPPVPPKDETGNIERVYPSVVCVEQGENIARLQLEFLDYYESASPVYGETFTYDPQGDLNFKFFCGSKQAGNLPVSYLEFSYGRCMLPVPGVDEFDRVEIWQGSSMISSKEITRREKVTAEAELEITSLYHYFDDDREMITTTVQKLEGGDCFSSYDVYAVVSQEVTNVTSGCKTNYPDYDTDPFELRFGEDSFATAPAFEIEPGGHNEVTITLYDEVSGEKIDSETLRV